MHGSEGVGRPILYLLVLDVRCVPILYLYILLMHDHFMYQSFVTTAPPPTGNGGDYDFSAFSALL